MKPIKVELKPCPFCGRTDLDDTSASTNHDKYYIGCPTCDFGFVRRTREEAVWKWNHRVD